MVAAVIIGPDHGPEVPLDLSSCSDKRDLYAADTYFRESWEDLVEIAADDAVRVAGVMASLTLKPDAIAARVGRRALEWLVANGFSIIAAERISFDRRMVRDTWRYAWNTATRDRREVVDLLMCSHPSLYLALKGSAPAALRLGASKGHADPSRRAAGDLREVLGATVPLLNLVHTADEPADVVRELGVYFDADVRERIYRGVALPPVDIAHVEVLLGAVEAESPAHDLALEPAVGRLLAELGHTCYEAELAGDLRSHLTGALEGEPPEWRSIARLLDALRMPCSQWDRIVIATHTVELDTSQWTRLLPSIP
jgi:nucleoside diphosphate kinase